MIFQSSRKKGLDKDGNIANDMKVADFTKENMLAIDKMFMFQLDEADDPNILFYELKFMSTGIFSTGEMEDVIVSMIDHFKKGTGADYSNATLTKHAKAHDTTKAYVKVVKSGLIEELKKNNGNLMPLQFDESTKKANPIYNHIQKEADFPVFHSNSDIIGGLTITVNDTWGNFIEVRDYTFDNNKFKGTLHFCIYDHFGLDKPDVEKIYVNLAGFRAWFVLQHYDKYKGKYKPFITLMEFDEPFEGELD